MPFHPELRTVQVQATAHAQFRSNIWPATGIIPWLCWPHAIPGDTLYMAMLARHWGILRGLNLPMPPANQAIPLVLKQPSTQPIAAPRGGPAAAADATAAAGSSRGRGRGAGAAAGSGRGRGHDAPAAAAGAGAAAGSSRGRGRGAGAAAGSGRGALAAAVATAGHAAGSSRGGAPAAHPGRGRKRVAALAGLDVPSCPTKKQN